MRPDGPRDPVAGPDDGPVTPYPLRLNGKVIKGFGRGSAEIDQTDQRTQLGIPTANIPLSGLSVGGHEDVESGVYYGWAGLSPSAATHQHPPGTERKYKHMAVKVYDTLAAVLFGGSTKDETEARDTFTHDMGAVYPMVMSIGWNPFYKNTVRSVEVHLMHHFDVNFYDTHMNLVILGFIRPEYDYVSKESLIEDITEDINVAGRSLGRRPYAKFRNDPYLLDFESKSDTAT